MTNPLNAILLCADGQGDCEHDDYADCMRAITQQAHRMRDTIEAVVTITQDQSVDAKIYDSEPLIRIREELRRAGYEMGAE